MTNWQRIVLEALLGQAKSIPTAFGEDVVGVLFPLSLAYLGPLASCHAGWHQGLAGHAVVVVR